MTRINQYNRNIKNKFRSKNAIREIYYYQKKTKLLIPKKSFERLIQEIIQNIQDKQKHENRELD
ncbi:histone H3.3-like type 1 [Apis mellifera]|uniref:Histone H3.3-like type 1 n=1 Tax=Apis mellifera TaxID=7460 RepID=A0A7M7GBE8_APIME|nr:histone H3.3-like type 1 [Apis mellifera]|eukprot:XP_003251618.1 histone H3.3-like type 1 [Apis mellifera]